LSEPCNGQREIPSKQTRLTPRHTKSTPPVSVKKTSGVLFVAKWRFENQTRKNVFYNQEGAAILISNLQQLNLRHKFHPACYSTSRAVFSAEPIKKITSNSDGSYPKLSRKTFTHDTEYSHHRIVCFCSSPGRVCWY